MTSFRRVLFLLATVLVSFSCSDKPDEDPGFGYRLYFQPESCEEMKVSESDGCILVELDGTTLSTHSDAIEEQIRRYYTLFLRRGEGGGNVITVDYRMERCEDIAITAPVALFGLAPGTDLSGKFEFLSSRDWTDFIITEDMRLIGTIPTGMTIREYLSKSPMAFPKALLRLTSAPADSTIETTLTISVTLEDKILSAELPVTL
ncbi:MAG: hypothetical protein IK143_01290 [Bacteroidales bacterium]|nr:hypothetical protein [Bacteroidales bacterium]